jgi:hypothetical protein
VTEQLVNRLRHQRAVELILAVDQHRLLSRLGRNTETDDHHVAIAHLMYGRTVEQHSDHA